MSGCTRGDEYYVTEEKFCDVPLLSSREIEEAHLRMVESPEQRIILRTGVRLEEFEYFEENHYDMLGGLKIGFEPILNDDKIGSQVSSHSLETNLFLFSKTYLL